MSIILEGIDLPKGEETEVIIRIQPNGDIKDEHGILLTEAKATQIPTPHGRLIDGDALDQYIEGKGFVIGYKAIDAQKVILEAEE